MFGVTSRGRNARRTNEPDCQGAKMPVNHAVVSEWRDEWTSIDDAAYLNTAAMSAMPRVSLDAVQVSLDAKRFPHHKSDAVWFEVTDRLRRSLATLIGARAEQIALTTG